MKLEGYSHHLLNIIPLNNGILEPDTEFTDYNYQEACEKLGITPISPTFDYIAYRQVVG